MNSSSADRQAEVASDTGDFVEKVAGAAAPSRSSLGRVIDTAVAAKVGLRLLPGAWRLFRRHPGYAALVIVGLAAAVRVFLAEGASSRRKPVA
jgi:hypothetical protein